MKRLMNKNWLLLAYGVGLALVMLLLRVVEAQFVIIHNRTEVYVGIIALIFTILGIWLARRLTSPKTEIVVVEKEVVRNMEPDPEAIAASELSKRELEVLQLMAAGLSNQEIAEKLFVSLNTVKTHASKVMEKLDVNRRTQAIEKARQQRLITT